MGRIESLAERAVADGRAHIPTVRHNWLVVLVILIVILGEILVVNGLDTLFRFGRALWILPVLVGLVLLASIATVAFQFGTARFEHAVGIVLISTLIASLILVSGAFVWVAATWGAGPIGAIPDFPLLLLKSGAALIAVNVGVFGIAFWEIDGPGPAHRSAGAGATYDFLFPQQQPDVEKTWTPTFGDYLYVSLTNSVAFSPTDAMPLTKKAKLLMGLESVISAVILLIVIASALNRL